MDEIYDFLIDFTQKENKFLNFLKDQLNMIIIERLKCAIIFKMIIDKINEIYYNSQNNEKMSRTLEKINNDIEHMGFYPKETDNTDNYGILLNNLVSYTGKPLDEIFQIFTELQDEKMHNYIVTEVKNIHEGRKFIKGHATQINTNNPGIRLVEQAGNQLTNTEKIINLTMLSKKTVFESQKNELMAIINKYNSIHKLKIIKTGEITDIEKLWTAISVKNECKHKKHINEYIIYAIRLVRPDINQMEAIGTLESQPNVRQSNINKFFTDFFNENRNPEFFKYAERHQRNIRGFDFDKTNLMFILNNYKPKNHPIISSKIMDEINNIQTIPELIKFLKEKGIIGNVIYEKYTDVPGEDYLKLTSKYTKNIIKNGA